MVERLGLAELTMRSLGREAEMPAKIGVHPRAPGSLAHAMPALLKGVADDGSEDLIGMKWIAGFPRNPSLGLATYNALVILNDAVTGLPIAVMDAGSITAQRTAAVSGVAIRRFAPEHMDRPAHVAILGAGAQARSHLPVIGHILPGATVSVTDVNDARSEALARDAAAIPGLGSVQKVGTVEEAVAGADVVVSVVSFGPERQSLDPGWLTSNALVVAVDYDMQAPAALAREDGLVIPATATAAEAEKLLILETLKRVGHNKAEAARQLGLDVKTIRNKLRSWEPGAEHR
jgi:ornithine cyclodeaminase/alanine dehydrogenase